MKLIDDNLKKTGYFNATLIVIAIILRVIVIPTAPILIKIDSIACLLALISGLVYCLNGYKKDVAKYYKAFMILYLISNISSIAMSILHASNIILIIANAVIIICVAFLALGKDLGEKKSNSFALVVLAINAIKLIYNIVANPTVGTVRGGITSLILACILCMFVSAKYADKASRGAK